MRNRNDALEGSPFSLATTIVESGSPMGVSTAPIPMAKQAITATMAIMTLETRPGSATTMKAKALVPSFEIAALTALRAAGRKNLNSRPATSTAMLSLIGSRRASSTKAQAHGRLAVTAYPICALKCRSRLFRRLLQLRRRCESNALIKVLQNYRKYLSYRYFYTINRISSSNDSP
jgi:hypothetical protein